MFLFLFIGFIFLCLGGGGCEMKARGLLRQWIAAVTQIGEQPATVTRWLALRFEH